MSAEPASILAAEERLIVALDCPPDEARLLARRLAGRARWLKVGMTLYYAEGPRVVHELREQGFKVFVDLKLHDIPHQARGAAASVVAAGADMFTVHAAGGLAMMRAVAEGVAEGVAAAGEQKGGGGRPLALAVTVLTSLDTSVLAQIGIARPLPEQVETLALLAREAGLDGVVASPREAQALRGLLGTEAAIVTPGIRPANAPADDQSRTATPAEALTNGASHLVVGRPITAAADPAAAFKAMVKEMEEVLL